MYKKDVVPKITWWTRDWGTTAFQVHSKVDIITTYHVPNRWGCKTKAYSRHELQHEYNSSSIHSNHHTEEQDPSTDENKRKRRTTSTLLILGSPPGTYSPWSKKKQKKNSKQASIAFASDHRITCTCNYCCSNLWATRTQQSHYHGYQD